MDAAIDVDAMARRIVTRSQVGVQIPPGL